MKDPSRIALVTVGGIVLAMAVVAWTETESAVPTGLPASAAAPSGPEPLPVARRRDAPPDGVASERPAPSVVPAAAAPAVNGRAIVSESDEAALMEHLHALGESDPASSLQLAKRGNERFGGTTDAAERAWIVVKSLVNMGRFDEARAEAAAMVQTYRGTSWAADVERHLLVNPLYPVDDGAP